MQGEGRVGFAGPDDGVKFGLFVDGEVGVDDVLVERSVEPQEELCVATINLAKQTLVVDFGWPDLEELGQVEEDGADGDGEQIELKVFLGDQRRRAELTEEADPDVTLEADKHSAVDGRHDGDVGDGQDVLAQVGRVLGVERVPDVRQSVGKGAADHH